MPDYESRQPCRIPDRLDTTRTLPQLRDSVVSYNEQALPMGLQIRMTSRLQSGAEPVVVDFSNWEHHAILAVPALHLNLYQPGAIEQEVVADGRPAIA